MGNFYYTFLHLKNINVINSNGIIKVVKINKMDY